MRLRQRTSANAPPAIPSTTEEQADEVPPGLTLEHANLTTGDLPTIHVTTDTEVPDALHGVQGSEDHNTVANATEDASGKRAHSICLILTSSFGSILEAFGKPSGSSTLAAIDSTLIRDGLGVQPIGKHGVNIIYIRRNEVHNILPDRLGLINPKDSWEPYMNPLGVDTLKILDTIGKENGAGHYVE